MDDRRSTIYFRRAPPSTPPSTPRRIWRPSWLPTVRAACLAIVSTMPWRRLVPNRKSFTGCCRSRRPGGARLCDGGSRRSRRRRGGRRRCRAASISYADSRLTAVSYLPPIGLRGAHGRALVVGDRADAAARRGHQRAFDRHRHALVLQRGHQRLADTELRDRLRDVELRIRHERFRRRLAPPSGRAA